MSNTIDAIQSWMSELQGDLSSLPEALEQAAPEGDFASVLESVQSLFASAPSTAGSTTSSETTTAPATSSSMSSNDVVSSGTAPSGEEVVETAEQYLGVPYVWGGTSPSGFDCSGLVQYVYGSLGVALPRTAAEQSSVGTPVASLADAEPGDLVFFPGADGTVAEPGHVGIYIGNGEMIDAPETGEDVSIQPVGDPSEIRRVLPDEQSATGSGTSASTTAPAGYEVPSSLASDFLSAAATYHVPATLLTAVAYTESGFDTTAKSSAGAEGIMQLMPQTAAGLGVDPYDPKAAINAAASLLSGYLSTYGGSVPLALAAYNAGPGAVAAAGDAVPDIAETQAYVTDVMSLFQGQSS